MSNGMLENSDSYDSLRDTAHQRPSSFCSEKAIVRHLSFWIENPTYEGEPESYVDYGVIRKNIDTELDQEQQLLDKLYKKLKELSNTIIKVPSRPFKKEDFNVEKGESHSIESGADSDGRYNRIIVSRTPNRVTIRHFLDYSYKSKGLGPENFKDDTQFHRSFKLLDEKIEYYGTLLEKFSAEKDTHELLKNGFWDSNWSDCKQAIDYLYSRVWNEIDSMLSHEYGEIFGEIQEPNNGLVLRKFADFRGLTYPADPFIPDLREGTSNGFVDKSDYELLRQNWPLVKASEYENPEDVDSYFSSNDVVACGVGAKSEITKNDGAGIYVSSLGQQNEYGTKPETKKSAPVKYLILAKNRNYRQIGRLVDRIERLGCYRLLALRDESKLRQIGIEIQKIGEAIDRLEEVSKEKDKDFGIVDEIGKSIQNLNRNLEGGLAYRVYMSSHYARSLKTLVKMLDFQKIPGFETYEEFVRRQLYQIYDSIEELGLRRERLQRRYMVLVSKLQLDRLNKSTDEGNSLLKIGHAVEFFAVSYYGGTIINIILNDIFSFFPFDNPISKAIPYIGLIFLWHTYGKTIRDKFLQN